MAMRVYALYDKSRLVLALLCTLALGDIGYSIVSPFLWGLVDVSREWWALVGCIPRSFSVGCQLRGCELRSLFYFGLDHVSPPLLSPPSHTRALFPSSLQVHTYVSHSSLAKELRIFN